MPSIARFAVHLVVSLCLITVVRIAVAEALIDQDHAIGQGAGAVHTFLTSQIAQTFTVGEAGLLSRVDLAINSTGSPPADLVFQLRELDGDVPADRPHFSSL